MKFVYAILLSLAVQAGAVNALVTSEIESVRINPNYQIMLPLPHDTVWDVKFVSDPDQAIEFLNSLEVWQSAYAKICFIGNFRTSIIYPKRSMDKKETK